MSYSEHKKRLVIHPFPYTVYVIACSDVTEARERYYKTLGHYRGVPADAMHVCVENVPASYIFINYLSDVDVIVHEALHCIWRIMTYVGARKEEEIMAYHLGSLTRTICLFLSKTAPDLDNLAK